MPHVHRTLSLLAPFRLDNTFEKRIDCKGMRCVDGKVKGGGGLGLEFLQLVVRCEECGANAMLGGSAVISLH
jgi:hypothetical protein